jgi:hypothetical protein
MIISKRHGLIALVIIALVLRALFTLYGASTYYGRAVPECYSFGDATTYMQSVENLINNGHYTFDFLEPDAAFGRLPGYPLFYGIHYIIFGPIKAIYATAWSQVILDSLTVLLVFSIVKRLASASRYAPWVGATLYATYPFIIFWVPMVYTELLSTDITLLLIYIMLRYTRTRWASLSLGMMVAVGLFMREYLGLFLPIALLWVVWAHGGLRVRGAWQAVALVTLGFGLVYIGWPIRNYIHSNRIVLLKPKTAGYASHKEDLDEFRSWLHCWTNDENPWIERVIRTKGPVPFPANVFANDRQQAQAKVLVAQARSCGSSFYMMRESHNSTVYDLKSSQSIYAVYSDTAFMMHDPTYLFYRNHNCNTVISAGFKQLRLDYARRNPVSYWFGVPSENLVKTFFKSGLAAESQTGGVGAKELAVKALFGYRTALLLLGILGLWQYRKVRGLWPIAIYAASIIFFICFLMRNLEMRYLLQADVLLLLPAALVLGGLADSLLAKKGQHLRPLEPAA